MTKSIPEMSVDTRLLYQHLSKLEIGAVVKYGELNDLIGRDVQGGARHHLLTAARACLRDGIVIATVHKIGVKRLADTEFVGVGERALAHTRRTARKAARAMVNADLAKLSPEQRTRHNAVQSALGVVTLFSKEKSVAKIATASKASELPVAKTLEMFK